MTTVTVQTAGRHSVPRPRGRALRGLLAGLLVASTAAVVLVSPAAPASAVSTTLSTTSIAAAASGGRVIYVSTSGSDTIQEYKDWYNGGSYKTYPRMQCLDDPTTAPESQTTCPEPTRDRPLRTIETAIRIAKPGDVIVVRGGTYAEAIGWGARRAYSTKQIVLQSYPAERVVVAGTLTLKNADYWNVRGIHFVYNSAIQTGQSVVAFSGGLGWTFANNEVTGSHGVANMLVQASAASSTTTAALTAAAPRNYKIVGNCIRDNRGTDAHGTDHNIYLMASIYSTGGLIERNLIAGASNGANIKAAASGTSTINASPRNVTIRYNTLLYAASGITIGLKAEKVLMERNLIANPSGSQQYDGGVKGYQLANPGANAVKDSIISGYAVPIREDYGAAHIFTARNVTTATAITGSVANCSARAASSTVSAKYGQFAG